MKAAVEKLRDKVIMIRFKFFSNPFMLVLKSMLFCLLEALFAGVGGFSLKNIMTRKAIIEQMIA